jgi:putative addiction module component (TIGR02574 family)
LAVTIAFSKSLGNNVDMSTEPQDLLQSALALPESDRAELAASLIRSLDTQSDDDVDAAWAAEIQRRIESIDNSEVKLIPWDDVMREMRDRKNG